MEIKKLALSVGLAVAALGSVGAAQAVPMLQIVDGAGVGKVGPVNTPCTLNAPGYNECEVTGDAGGTVYPGSTAAPGGVPSALGGWPNGPGFAADGSFNDPAGAPAMGTSGWHASYLNLSQSSNIGFQYMGDGNASNHNQFEVFVGGAWTLLFDNNQANNPNQTFFFNAGYVPFRYLASIGTAGADTFTNDGTNNPDPDVLRGGYFLGVDPYLATAAFQNSGAAVYAGLSDGGLAVGMDHDYQDLGVRITVPEPGSIFLLGGGLLGLAGLRKRRV